MIGQLLLILLMTIGMDAMQILLSVWMDILIILLMILRIDGMYTYCRCFFFYIFYMEYVAYEMSVFERSRKEPNQANPKI
jgi:hypothetical protein